MVQELPDCIIVHILSYNAVPAFDAVAWCRLCERAYQHTVLVDQISEQIKQDSNVIHWIRATQDVEVQTSSTTNAEDEDTDTEQRHSWLPDGLAKDLCAGLKETPQFKGMSGRSYTSAIDRVEGNFKGWFASHQKLIRQIRGKRRWLAVVGSEAELAENSNFSQPEIQSRAEQILAQIEVENESEENNRPRVFDILFDAFDAAEDVLNRRAIIHLLINGGKVRLEPKQSRKHKDQKVPVELITLEARLLAKRVEIERLEQLLSQLPRARNLFPDWAFEATLEDLLTLPNPDHAKHDHYYFLAFSLLIHRSNSQLSLRLYEVDFEEGTTVKLSTSQFLVLLDVRRSA